MNILLGFAPYIAFFLVMQAVSIDAGLWTALIVAVLIADRNWRRSGSLKVLEAGPVLVFAVSGHLHSSGTLEMDGHGSPTSGGCRPTGNRNSFAGDRTSLHFAVRPREGRPTVLAYAILSEHQSPDHLGMGWCIRGAGDGTCCGRLHARRTLVARYCSYNL